MLPSAPRWAEFRSAAAAVERWLLPGECVLCHEGMDASLPDALVCGPCRSRWPILPTPVCSRCGQPLTPGIECRICSGWAGGFGAVRSAFWLEGGARQAVHLLKYEGWWRVAEAMASGMSRWVTLAADVTLVPIPLGVTRLRARGYNQSGALAIALGKLLRVPVAEHALRRRRETTTQTALTPEERRSNLAGAFVAQGKLPARPVLVDDVFTTGATLAEAASALLAGGAAAVSGITFARAPRPLAAAAAAPAAGPDHLKRSRA